MLFPRHSIAVRCVDYMRNQVSAAQSQTLRIIKLCPHPRHESRVNVGKASPTVSAVIFPEALFRTAKSFWQHTGDGISSRRAEFCCKAFEDGLLVDEKDADEMKHACKGPKRYQKHHQNEKSGSAPIANGHVVTNGHSNGVAECQDTMQFVEERFGRNLDLSLAAKAKLAVRRRIAGAFAADLESLDDDTCGQQHIGNVRERGFSEDDVYLFPTGMSSIFNMHRLMLEARGPLKSICYGFPYIDTLKILEKFGPGCLFYGHGSSQDLDDLEKRLKDGETYLALFCEAPGNPLLRFPDLTRIRTLADDFDFAVIVDETIGNFLNIQVLPYADVVVSSLTKIFSGDCNVMAGSAVLNPKSRYYALLKRTLELDYEDDLWPADAMFLERNSRDFAPRIACINNNAMILSNLLSSHPRIKAVYYPALSPTRPFYDRCRTPNGGYGGLLSATFWNTETASKFYDALETAKGPSLGTNFTLSSPYVLLAHYTELEWAERFGVERDLIRFSVGLEPEKELVEVFQRALKAIE